MSRTTNANVCPVTLRDFPTGLAVLCFTTGAVVAAARDLEGAVDTCNRREWLLVAPTCWIGVSPARSMGRCVG